MRRFHEGARDQREVGHHRLRHVDLARFRGSLSLLGVIPAFSGSFILTRRDDLGNTESRGQRYRYRLREREPQRQRHGH